MTLLSLYLLSCSHAKTPAVIEVKCLLGCRGWGVLGVGVGGAGLLLVPQLTSGQMSGFLRKLPPSTRSTIPTATGYRSLCSHRHQRRFHRLPPHPHAPTLRGVGPNHTTSASHTSLCPPSPSVSLWLGQQQHIFTHRVKRAPKILAD